MGCKSSRDLCLKSEPSNSTTSTTGSGSCRESEESTERNFSVHEILDHDREGVSAFLHLRSWASSQVECQVIDTTARKAYEDEFLELTHLALHLPCEVELMPIDDAPPFVVDRVKFLHTVRNIVDHADTVHASSQALTSE